MTDQDTAALRLDMRPSFQMISASALEKEQCESGARFGRCPALDEAQIVNTTPSTWQNSPQQQDSRMPIILYTVLNAGDGRAFRVVANASAHHYLFYSPSPLSNFAAAVSSS